MNWQQIKPLLYPGQEIALMVHERPDGDALGSALGFGIMLRAMGYCPTFYRVRPLDPLYTFLPGQNLVKVVGRRNIELPKNGAVIVLDCGDEARCEYFLGKKRPLLNVDHHISNPYFGVLNWVNPTAAATAEVLWQIFHDEGIPLVPEAATCFYTAMLTDTGWFRFQNVGWRTLNAAADMVRQGADLDAIRYNLAERRPMQELHLMKIATQRMEPYFDGQVFLCTLPYEIMVQEKLMTAETDQVLELMRSMEGIEGVALIKEVEPGVHKISFRTKVWMDASVLAAHFGGGGHIRAAGCTFRGSMEEAQEEALALMKKSIDERNADGRDS